MPLVVVADILAADRLWAQRLALANRVASGLQSRAPGDLAPEDEAGSELGAALDLAAQSLMELGRLDEAERRYREALSLVAGNDLQTASIEHQLGRIAQQQGDLDVAEHHYRTAARLGAADDGIHGRALQQLGRLAQKRDDPSAAMKLFHDAGKAFRACNDLPATSASLYQSAVAAQEGNDLGLALKLCEQALDLRRQLRDQIGITNCLHQLSIILAKKHDLVGASGSAECALRVANRAGYHEGEATALLRLAELTLSADPSRREEADRLLHQALGVLRGTEPPELRARLHAERGRLLTEMGRFSEALPHSARALLLRTWLPQPVGNDAYWLRLQRSALGEPVFTDQLTTVLGSEPAQQLSTALARLE